MRVFEAGCVDVPRGDGSFFSTIYDVPGHGAFTAGIRGHSAFDGLARAVFNFASMEEAEIVTPQIVKALNALKL